MAISKDIIPKPDLQRCAHAMRFLEVRGIVGSSAVRQEAIEHAIAAIQRDPKTALSLEYIGVKNYAGFGDQREDHRYNLGPRHGTIVFRIGRVGRALDTPLPDDAVHLLLAARGWRGLSEDTRDPQRRPGRLDRVLDLCEVVERALLYASVAERYRLAVAAPEPTGAEAEP